MKLCIARYTYKYLPTIESRLGAQQHLTIAKRYRIRGFVHCRRSLISLSMWMGCDCRCRCDGVAPRRGDIARRSPIHKVSIYLPPYMYLCIYL